MNDGAGATRGESVHRLSRFMRDVALSRAAPPPQPGSVEALAGVFIAEVRRIWEDRNVGDYLAASEARRHVWHCWMASERDTIERRFRAFPALALRRLTAHKARDLLAGAYGSCPPGLVKALGRCGPEARSRDFYRSLVLALSGEPARAKAIWHASVLTDALVLETTSSPAQTPAPRPTPFGSGRGRREPPLRRSRRAGCGPPGLHRLAALCHRCHILHDRTEHLHLRQLTYLARRALGDLFTGPCREA